MLANLSLAGMLLAMLAWSIFQTPDEHRFSTPVAALALTTLVLIALALRRPPARAVDRRLGVKILCLASTFYVLAYERVPIDDDAWLTSVAYWGRLSFHVVAALALISLGTSFALLPALRQVQSGFLYRWVRHPVYSLYMAADVAFLGLQFSWWNLAVAWIAAWLFVQRALIEEALLDGSPEYQDYRQRVPYRFIPFVI